MRYRRSGAGGVVLVLVSPDQPDSLWPELSAALAARFRVIVPELDAAGASAAVWLADFLEGLGFARVAVVAADAYCIPALELALLDADQLSRVVLVPGGDTAARAAGLDGALGASPPQAAVPLLVVRRGLAAAEALPLVTGFLAGDAPAAVG
jgi:pimeloyl-ACP methyl ester carboxylesterase